MGWQGGRSLNRWLLRRGVGLWTVGILLAGGWSAAYGAESGSLQPQVESYLAQLAEQGFPRTAQGVWLQAGEEVLAQHQGSTPLPAASLTKVATTLASLYHFGPEHRFVTLFGTSGTVAKGLVKGDLWVLGGEDPLFVWEEAIAVGNVLNGQGIRQVTGDLVIVGRFYMNFSLEAARSGALLRQGLDRRRWSEEVEAQFQTLPPGTPRPEVEILGTVRVAEGIPAGWQPLVQHESPPLIHLLKQMNLYSNNWMAEMLANAVGGAERVAQISRLVTGIPAEEIQLINGSGLGVQNRMSPRGSVALLRAIQALLEKKQLSLADVFAVVGQDVGVLERRLLPTGLIAKSGTLNGVSTLAGVLPTAQGEIWFALMNGGADLVRFRTEQGRLLSQLQAQRGSLAALPPQWIPKQVATQSRTRWVGRKQ